jgi:N-acyl amino acid synthase of PEP-CTERM/exosortase system
MTENTIAHHFHEYFSICNANTEDLKKEVFKLRYDVYCAELGYEKDCPIDCEKDKFDEYSKHVLVKHRPSGIYAGCVRVVTPPPHNPKVLLPFEVNCSDSFDPKKVAFLRDGEYVQVGEASRLAVRSNFRRRASDAKSPDSINPERVSLDVCIERMGMRYFPFIAVALYFGATSLLRHQNIKYAVLMMEPRLARLLKRIEINFIQLGETIDYHRLRALYYIEPTFVDALKPELKEFYYYVDQQLR